MHRPMECPHDANEERDRLVEYSRILKKLPYSEFVTGCEEPQSEYRGLGQDARSEEENDRTRYPTHILRWQYEEGLLSPELFPSQLGKRKETSGVSWAVERRSELARRLAVYIVASDAGMSREHLEKMCRRFEPPKLLPPKPKHQSNFNLFSI